MKKHWALEIYVFGQDPIRVEVFADNNKLELLCNIIKNDQKVDSYKLTNMSPDTVEVLGWDRLESEHDKIKIIPTDVSKLKTLNEGRERI